MVLLKLGEGVVGSQGAPETCDVDPSGRGKPSNATSAALALASFFKWWQVRFLSAFALSSPKVVVSLSSRDIGLAGASSLVRLF